MLQNYSIRISFTNIIIVISLSNKALQAFSLYLTPFSQSKLFFISL